MNSTSPSGKLDLTDFKKLLRDATIVGVGAGLVYAAQNVASVNFGEYTPFLVPVVSFLIDGIYRYYRDNTKVE